MVFIRTCMAIVWTVVILTNLGIWMKELSGEEAKNKQ